MTVAPANLLRSSSVMAAGTVFSRITGFIRDVFVAAAIGTAVLGDAFAAAHTLPTILYMLLAGGVLNAVFVPQLIRAMKEHADGGQGYADRLLTLTGVSLLAITAVATVAAPLIMRIYWPPGENLSVVILLAFWSMPQVFFYGMTTILGQVLNARGYFGPMMWAPILNNLIMIASAILFMLVIEGVDTGEPLSVPDSGLILLAAGSTLGVIVQALVLIPVLKHSGYHFRPRFDFRGFGLRKAATLAKWTLLLVAINQIGYGVVFRVATNVSNSAADLSYGIGLSPYQRAYLILLLPHAIATVSVVTALVPRMSAAAVDGKLERVREDISTGLRLCAVVAVPAATAFLLFGREIGIVLYAPAGLASAEYIGLVLMAFGPGLIAFTGHYLALRGFYAQEDTRTPFLIAIVINAVNVALALLAYNLVATKYVTIVLAAGYSISYFVGMTLSFSLLRRRTGGLDGARVLSTYLRLILATSTAAAPAWLCAIAMPGESGESFHAALTALAAGGAVFTLGFLVMAKLLRVSELTMLAAVVASKLRPSRVREKL